LTGTVFLSGGISLLKIGTKCIVKFKKRKEMKLLGRALAIILFIPLAALSQQKDTLTKRLDSLSIKASDTGQENNLDPAGYEHTKLDLRTYYTLLKDDFKQDLTLPFHTKGKDWFKVAGFALATGAVALANKPINEFATNVHNNNPAVASASKYITRFGGSYEIYTLGGFFAYGLIFNTQREKTTTMLATQAYIIAGVIGGVGKFLFAEQRPYYTDPISGQQGPIFHGPFYAFKKGPDGRKLSHSDYASFPSGHTTAAFAAATVYAMEYKDKPLIPILSYTAATLIGLSRLTENQHWPVDVVVGAMLGYLSGRQVVNNYHRYSKLKQAGKTPRPVTFNLQYFNGQIIPGMVYNF
jgi:membrane-associated phospholipid phosphatase